MNQPESFADLVLRQARKGKGRFPQVVYDQDGDCVEFLAKDEDFYAKRLNAMVTVYIGRESGDIVGSLVKGIHSTITKIKEAYPGFAVEIKAGRIRLDHLFSAIIWKSGDCCEVEAMLKLREIADDANAEAELELAEA